MSEPGSGATGFERVHSSWRENESLSLIDRRATGPGRYRSSVLTLSGTSQVDQTAPVLREDCVLTPLNQNATDLLRPRTLLPRVPY